MNPSDFAALLGSIKTASDIARLIKDSGSTLEKVEAKLKLAGLISALADAKIEAAEIQQAVLEKDDRIRALEREAKTRASLVWREPCYWLPNGEGREEPYCQHCHDDAQKLARLHTDGKGMYSCRVCDKNYSTQERRERDAAAFMSARRVVSRGIT